MPDTPSAAAHKLLLQQQQQREEEEELLVRLRQQRALNEQLLQQAQLQTADFTASNSVVAFTSTFSQDVTARVESLDAKLATGEVALFQEDNSKLTYLFVQGGSAADTVVQIGTAEFTDGNTNALSASVTVSGSTIAVNL